ncbi:MAG TPA: hypothetical protein ENN60_04030 [archaeon]|nr:hypothetical protein [archaeon]
MEREKLLEANFREFHSDAIRAMAEGHFTSAYVLWFKALVALTDLKVFRQKGVIPRNHIHRFEMLTFIDPELKHALSDFFREYTEAYSSQMTQRKCEEVKAVAEKLARELGVL